MDYRVTRNVFTGSQTIHYACPKCGTALESNLEDAGDDDTCPECSTHFFVPGERELDEEIRLQEQRDREAEQERQAEERKARQAAQQAKQAAREQRDAAQIRTRRVAQLIVSSGAICEQYETIGLVVGCGSWIDDYMRFELDGLGVLSRAQNGVGSYRPFDRRRDGFFPAEGAAVLILEAADAARERGARPLGRILGTGNFQEIVSPDHLAIPSKSIPRACRSAMNGAEIPPEELAFILPHGSGTRKGDKSELRGLKEYLGEAGKGIPLAGWKPYTGHMGSASDIGELILGLYALDEGVLPPTPRFGQSDREFKELNIPGAECRVGGKAFLSLSHGLGGQSSATLISAP